VAREQEAEERDSAERIVGGKEDKKTARGEKFISYPQATRQEGKGSPPCAMKE